MDEPAPIAPPEPPPSAPPTIPGPIRRAATGPLWHIPIGAVTIMVAALGIAISLINLATVALDPVAGSTVFDAATASGRALVCIALLTGAIALLCRQRWAVRTVVIAAIARVLLEIAGPLGALWGPDHFSQLAGSVWLAWVVGWPAFLCIWFVRPRIRAQVRAWGRATQPV